MPGVGLSVGVKRTSFVSSRFHDDTLNWQSRVLSAEGTVSTAKLNEIDAAVRYAYDNGLRGGDNPLRYLLAPSASDGFIGCNVPLFDDGVGNATLNNYVSGDGNASGLAGDGSTKFIDTGWIPSSKGISTTGCLFQ